MRSADRPARKRPFRPTGPIRRVGNPGGASKKARWDGDPLGRAFKLLLDEIVSAKAGRPSRLIDNRDFAAIGIHESFLRRELEIFCPYWAQWYLESSNRTAVSPKACYNRVYVMHWHYDDAKKVGIAEVSSEHPTRNLSLKPYINAAAAIYRRGKPVSKTVSRALFDGPGHSDEEVECLLDADRYPPRRQAMA